MVNTKTEMTKEFNPWKYVKVDPDSVKNNPYLNPKKKDVEPKATAKEPSQSPVKVFSKDDYLVLEDLVCTDAEGNVFERYDNLYVRKDVERNNANQVDFTPYQAIVHFESQNHFLPSFALSCNILATLYADKTNLESNAVLMQYKDKGNGYGWQAQNTVVKWNKGKGEVIHYPYDSDFPNNGGSDNINQGKRHSLDFKVKGFKTENLEAALKNKHFNTYIKNLTGLPNPEILVEIGDYFSKPAKVWLPINIGNVATTRASWLGCYGNGFYLYTSGILSNSDAARGVLFGEPR